MDPNMDPNMDPYIDPDKKSIEQSTLNSIPGWFNLDPDHTSCLQILIFFVAKKFRERHFHNFFLA